MSREESAPRNRPPSRHRVFSDDAAGTTRWALALLLTFVSVFSVVVWVLVSIDEGALAYPWPLWVAGPAGALLVTLYAAGIGRPRT